MAPRKAANRQRTDAICNEYVYSKAKHLDW
jgi:hypothetical protein